MKEYRKAVLAVMCILPLLLCSCAHQEKTEEQQEEEVVIPVMLRMDPQTNEPSNYDLVEEFNRAYEGKYRVEAEWIMETDSGYRTRLKQLNAVDKLPAVITDVGFDDNFLQLLKENARLADLSSYIENAPEWKEAIREDIYKEMVEEDGAVYVSPLGELMYSYAGIIYNKEMLENAGYETFPDTWEGFFECLDALEQTGVTPLSLHGGGEYWVPMLLSTAYVCREEDGKAFINQKFPETYQNDAMRDLMQFMKRIYGYSYEDALNIEYNVSEQRFLRGEAAVIANGSWLFMGLAEEEKAKYGFACFPEERLVGSWEMSAWAVVSTQLPEVQEGAVEFLKFRTLKLKADIENDMKRTGETDDRGIMRMYQEQAVTAREFVPNYQINWEQSITRDFMTLAVPAYVNGQMDLEEFLYQMDQALGNIGRRQ